MSGGPDHVTSTTNSEPPAFMRNAMGQASDMSSYFFNQDWENMKNTGDYGPIPRGTQLINQTLQGDFLSPDTNPYLEQTFNRAADLTRGRLDTEFSGAGRNLGASLPARSEELQTLANSIYGGNYQAERNRQGDYLGFGQQYDPTNLLINRLAGLIPGAGGSTQSTQPVFRTGLF